MTDLSRARWTLLWFLGVLAVGCAGSEFTGDANHRDAGRLDGGADAVGSPGGSEPLPDVPPPVHTASVVGGISILPAGGLVTSEGGDQASFEVVLVDEPSDDVTIPLESGDPGEGTITITELVFPSDAWDLPQTVVVTGQDDDEVDGHQGYVIVTGPAESRDPHYGGVDAADVAIANLDDDELGVRFEPATGLVTSEGGAQAQVSARLSSRPSDDVAVFLESSDASEGTVTPAALTFTPDNWDSPKMLTVTGVDDQDADGAVNYRLVISDVISGDDEYSGLDLDAFGVEIQNTDDDSAGVTVAGDALIVSEAGSAASFTVALNRAPSALVLIPVTSTDEGEATVEPQLLSFTTDNWNAPQEVVVTGADDSEADGDQELVIALESALSSDPAYDGLDVPDVTVTTLDDESAGVTVTPQHLQLSEAGTSASFEVRLTTEPSAPVTVGLTVNDGSEASLDRSELTFAPGNWQMAQTVAVTGVDDEESDGNQSFVVQTAPAQSEDDAYRGLNAPDVTGLTLDDETAGVTVTPSDGLVTSESGEVATFEIALLSRPGASVRITLQSSDVGEGEVDVTEVEFGPEDWEAPRTVTVTGVDDPATDGAQPFTIVTELVTADPAYTEVVVADVTALNRDDECPLPEVIDDFEDGDLVICPSAGRAGSWVAENAGAGDLGLMASTSNRADSAFELFGSYVLDANNAAADGADPFERFPVLAATLGAPDADGALQPFNAGGHTGFSFWARANPAAELAIALVTTDSFSPSAAASCSGGCTGHFTSSVQLGTGWENYSIEFDTLTGAREGASFDARGLVGLKFALVSTEGGELWLDDVIFVQ